MALLSSSAAALAGATATPLAMVAAGGRTRRNIVRMAAGPGGFLLSKSSRRLAVVAAAAAAPAPAGGSNNDREKKFKNLPGNSFGFSFGSGLERGETFRSRLHSQRSAWMQLFKMSQKPVALLGIPREMLMFVSYLTKGCNFIMESILVNEPVLQDAHKDTIVSAGKALLIVEGQYREGYLRADAIVDAITALTIVEKTFFDPPKHAVPTVPSSGEDVDKESYFKDLVTVWQFYYVDLLWEAQWKYQL
ncbi:hypothetical protein EJB05_39858 [Eragrostis curvula]|uniref:Chlorophyll a-b binding protein, chloroplastic n=1 Tax=Eragrostis curvula TaxID=38414 RepID=A0A5J9U000_9POAL|nr:hypothetical protein EJB05_39858 [Eragrostis curvula]